jgi:protein SCO1/2
MSKLAMLFLLCGLGSFAHGLDIFQPGLKWTDENAKTIEISDWKNGVVVASMAYVTCTKTCPFKTMATMKQVHQYFRDKQIPAEYVVISFDPESETPREWASYKERNKVQDPNWHFLLGSLAQTHSIAESLGLGDYWKVDEHVIHGFRVLVYNKGQLEKVFDSSNPSNNESLEKLVAKIQH